MSRGHTQYFHPRRRRFDMLTKGNQTQWRAGKAVGKTGLVDIEGNVGNETRSSNPCQMGTEVPLKNHSGMIEKQV